MLRDTISIITIVGARPQFIKAAAVSHAILRAGDADGCRIQERIIHTGQHHDALMSQVFFDEMCIPAPIANMGIAGGTHGAMTGAMLTALELHLLREKPSGVLVYGDTNSTLAGALAACKIGIPVCHVEAGLRSFNRRMPEETNRIVADHVSSLLFCPTRRSVEHLAREGITEGVVHVGDVMFDVALRFGALARERSIILDTLTLKQGEYALATLHRAENTDDPAVLSRILDGLSRLSRHIPVVLPLHPRTRHAIDQHGLNRWLADLVVTEPLGVFDMIAIEMHARVILTDSGGVQKEAYFHRVPCITLRNETEWTETIETGWNRLAGTDPDAIADALHASQGHAEIADFGEGYSADAIVRILKSRLG